MLNREKYAKEIIEIACNGGNIAVVNGKLENCRKTQCNECNFNGGTIRDCDIKTRKWANSEYVEPIEPIEPPVDWSKVPVDTPVLVKIEKMLLSQNGKRDILQNMKTEWCTLGRTAQRHGAEKLYLVGCMPSWQKARKVMIECIRTAARDSKTERIKVSCLDIIVTMIEKKPYYEIKYKEIGEDYYHVG